MIESRVSEAEQPRKYPLPSHPSTHIDAIRGAQDQQPRRPQTRSTADISGGLRLAQAERVHAGESDSHKSAV